MSKINNQVIASSYSAVDNKFVGDKISLDVETLAKYKKEYAKFTRQILKDNPDLSFDYSHYPSLTISHNYSAVAVITPNPTLEGRDFSNSYGALLTDAFRHKDTLEALKNVFPSFGIDFEKMRVREDLGEKQELVNKSFEAIQDGSDDFSHYTNVRQGMKPPKKVVEDAPVEEDMFSFSNPDLQNKVENLNEANEARKNLNDNFDPNNVEDVHKKSKLHDGIKQALHDQNGRAADEDDWLEKRMKELGLYFNHHKTPAYKNLPLPFIHDITIHDKHNRELLSWRTGGGTIKIHEAGIFHEAAGQLACEAAYKKFGHDKVFFNVSAKAMEQYKDNLGMIYEQKLNQLIKAGFEPEQIHFHKDWQYLVTMKVNEMKNLAELGQATPEQVAESKSKQEANPDDEGAKPDQGKPSAPVATGEPDKAVPAGSSPVNQQTIPNEPAAGDVPANAAPATPEAPAQKKTIINGCTLVKTHANEDPAKERYNLVGVKGEVESMSGPTLQKVFDGLTKAAGISVSQVSGCWLSDGQVFTYGQFKKAEAARLEGMTEEQIKENKEDYNFQAAYDVLKELKEAAKLALATQGVPVADVVVDAVADVVVDAGLPAAVAEPVLGDVPERMAEQIPDDVYDFDKDILENKELFNNSFDVPETVQEAAEPVNGQSDYSIEEMEAFLAEEFGMPEILDSPEYADLKEARETASEKVEGQKHDDSGIDYSSATKDLDAVKEKVEKAKSSVRTAIANETRRTNIKSEV